MIDYLVGAFRNGGYMLLYCVLPWLGYAVVMQLVSHILRTKLAGAIGLHFWIYLTAPGTMIHELGHALFCIVFRHKIVRLTLFSPSKDGTLGSVSHSYNPKSLYQRIGNLFIGIGPIIGGTVLLCLLSGWLLPDRMLAGTGSFWDQVAIFGKGFLWGSFWTSWKSWLWLYLAFSIASHITLSPPDLEGAQDGLFFLVIGIFLACILFGWCGYWEQYICAWSMAIFSAMLPILGVIIFVMCCIALALKLITR